MAGAHSNIKRNMTALTLKNNENILHNSFSAHLLPLDIICYVSRTACLTIDGNSNKYIYMCILPYQMVTQINIYIGVYCHTY